MCVCVCAYAHLNLLRGLWVVRCVSSALDFIYGICWFCQVISYLFRPCLS